MFGLCIPRAISASVALCLLISTADAFPHLSFSSTPHAHAARSFTSLPGLSLPPPHSGLLSSSHPSKLLSSSTLSAFASFPSRVNISLPDGTGTVSGVSIPQYGLEAFLGIPFAQAPTGDLRFNKPQVPTKDSSRMIDASSYGLACIQQTDDTNAIGEDCLSINVVRPASVPSDAALPVITFIYGGAFTNGASSLYNSTLVVLQSMMRGQPVIYVSFNYRLGALGFLASTDIQKAAANGTASLNSGLYDMQLALQWVQNNIKAFGGDKDKVTVWGQSAGAIAIGSLLTADEGQAVSKLNLFRAAILESGAPQGVDVTTPNSTDAVYNAFISQAGCSSTPTLDCLRAASIETIYSASNTVGSAGIVAYPYNRVNDGYFHDRPPSLALADGLVAKVPVITGNVLDEGTEFVPTDITDDADITSFFSNRILNGTSSSFAPALSQALTLYPDDPSQGSPYVPTNTSTTYRFFGGTNQFKRMSSLIGDTMFQSGRRSLLSSYTSRNASYPAWSYLFVTNTPGADPTLGVSHASDLQYVYGFVAQPNVTTTYANTSLTMLNAWINFAWTLDPNGPGVPTWPKYGSDSQILQINETTYNVMTDDYRKEPMDFLQSSTWTEPLEL